MMDYEKFKKIITSYIDFVRCEDALRELKIDIWESTLFNTPGYLLDRVWEAYFTEEGIDTINWWMFEYHELEDDFDNYYNPIDEREPGMWDEKDNPIPMNSIEDLWNYVKGELLEKEPEHTIKEVVNSGISAIINENIREFSMDNLEMIIDNEDIFSSIKLLFKGSNKVLTINDSKPEVAEILSKKFVKPACTPEDFTTKEGLKMQIVAFDDDNVGTVFRLSYDNHTVYFWAA